MLIIISIICFLAIFKVLKNLETKEWRGEWKSIRLKRGLWILITIGCLIPIFNLFLTILLLLLVFIETRVGDLRFKGGKKIWLDKFIDFLNKEV